MVMLSYMDSEGSIEPVTFSAKNTHYEYSPTLTEALAVEEAYQWLKDMNI